MKLFSLLSLLFVKGDCVANDLGFQELLPRDNHPTDTVAIAEQTPIIDPNTEPTTTSFSPIGVASYYPPVHTITEVITVHATSCPFVTGTVDVFATTTEEVSTWYTYTTDGSIVVQATPTPWYTYTTDGTLVVQSVTTHNCPVPTSTFEITSTFEVQSVTQTTCEYSVETVRMDIIKTIYVKTCVNDTFEVLATPIVVETPTWYPM